MTGAASRLRLLAAGMLALLGLQAGPAAACRTERVAELPIKLAQGFPLVPVTAAGRTWPFLLDTGAQDMLVTPWAAEAMRLRPDPGRRTRVVGTDSVSDAPNVLLAGLYLDGLRLPTRSVPAATLPGFEQVSPSPAGIIGAPVLEQFDILFDGPGQQVSFYAVAGCAAVPVPFAPPFARVPLRRLPGGEALLPITLGGVRLEAVLDTGARGTVIAANAPGAGGRGLRVGEDSLPELKPTVAPLPLAAGQALLGMDYLGARRTWISYATNVMLVELPRRGAGPPIASATSAPPPRSPLRRKD